MKSELKSLRNEIIEKLNKEKPGSGEYESLTSELEVILKAENENTRITLENERREAEYNLEKIKYISEASDKNKQQKLDNIMTVVNTASKFVVPLGLAVIFASLERDGFIATKIYQMIPKSIKF